MCDDVSVVVLNRASRAAPFRQFKALSTSLHHAQSIQHSRANHIHIHNINNQWSYQALALEQTDRPRSTLTLRCVRLNVVDWRRRGRTGAYHAAWPSISSSDAVTPTPPCASYVPASSSLTAIYVQSSVLYICICFTLTIGWKWSVKTISGCNQPDPRT